MFIAGQLLWMVRAATTQSQHVDAIAAKKRLSRSLALIANCAFSRQLNYDMRLAFHQHLSLAC